MQGIVRGVLRTSISGVVIEQVLFYRRFTGCDRCREIKKVLQLNFTAKDWISTTRKLSMVRGSRRLDKQKCNYASTAIVCMRAAKGCAHCFEKLSTAQCNSQTQK